MRCLVAVVLLLSLALSVSAGGARFPTFASTSPLESKTLPAKFEELPEETLPAKQLEDVINKQYIDQDIKQPKMIYQPIVQQRLVYQPIIRTRLVHQPITRRIFNKNVVRPHVRAVEQLVPVYKQQDVLVPKIEERTVVKEEFSQKQHTMPTVTEPTTYAGKSREQLYGSAGF